MFLLVNPAGSSYDVIYCYLWMQHTYGCSLAIAILRLEILLKNVHILLLRRARQLLLLLPWFDTLNFTFRPRYICANC